MPCIGLCGHCRRHPAAGRRRRRMGRARSTSAALTSAAAVAAAAAVSARPRSGRATAAFAQMVASPTAPPCSCARGTPGAPDGPTAAAAIYGPIRLWDISQVTDLSSRLLRELVVHESRLQPSACRSFNSDISGWDTSIVTNLAPYAPPLILSTHPL